MLYLVTLYRSNDGMYEDAWDDTTVVGVFNSLSFAKDAIVNDYKKQIGDGADIEETIIENGEVIYDSVVDWDYETVEYQWSIKPIEVNEILTKKKEGEQDG